MDVFCQISRLSRAQPTVELCSDLTARSPGCLWLVAILVSRHPVLHFPPIHPSELHHSLYVALLPPCFSPLSFYPSVPISQEQSPINLFKQPSEYLIHFSEACEREPVHWASIPMPGILSHPQPPPPLHFPFLSPLLIPILIIIFILPLLLPPLVPFVGLIVAEIAATISFVIVCRAGRLLMHSVHYSLDYLNS